MDAHLDSGEEGSAPFPEQGSMQGEAHAIIDAARAAGLTVRLVGGLAVLEYCRDKAACRGEHRDVDFVTRRRDLKTLSAVLARFGYEENPHVRLASAGRCAQYHRPCVHAPGGRPAHDDDRIDVYLDTFRLHHHIRLGERLGLHDYAVPATDALLIKLQRGALGPLDLIDVVAILKDSQPGSGADQLDIGYISRLCARDWGLGHDVLRSLETVRAIAPEACPVDDLHKVMTAIDQLEDGVRHERKSLRWRVRALAGEHLPWQDAVDESDGLRLGQRERPAA